MWAALQPRKEFAYHATFICRLWGSARACRVVWLGECSSRRWARDRSRNMSGSPGSDEKQLGPALGTVVTVSGLLPLGRLPLVLRLQRPPVPSRTLKLNPLRVHAACRSCRSLAASGRSPQLCRRLQQAAAALHPPCPPASSTRTAAWTGCGFWAPACWSGRAGLQGGGGRRPPLPRFVLTLWGTRPGAAKAMPRQQPKQQLMSCACSAAEGSRAAKAMTAAETEAAAAHPSGGGLRQQQHQQQTRASDSPQTAQQQRPAKLAAARAGPCCRPAESSGSGCCRSVRPRQWRSSRTHPEKLQCL